MPHSKSLGTNYVARQIHGEEVDGAENFRHGCMLYECLAGETRSARHRHSHSVRRLEEAPRCCKALAEDHRGVTLELAAS